MYLLSEKAVTTSSPITLRSVASHTILRLSDGSCRLLPLMYAQIAFTTWDGSVRENLQPETCVQLTCGRDNFSAPHTAARAAA